MGESPEEVVGGGGGYGPVSNGKEQLSDKVVELGRAGEEVVESERLSPFFRRVYSCSTKFTQSEGGVGTRLGAEVGYAR